MSGKPGMKRPRVRLANDRERLLLVPSEIQLVAADEAYCEALEQGLPFDDVIRAVVTAAIRAKPS